MKAYRPVILTVLAILIIGCEEKAFNPAIPKGPDFSLTPMENEEAELAAIFLSEELIAPVQLYKQFRDEVLLIRNTWEDSKYHTEIEFTTPYIMSEVLIITSGAVYDSMQSGNYHHWDSLNSYYRLDSIRFYFRSDDYSMLTIRFKGRLNSNILAEKYIVLPGIRYAELNYLVGEFPVILPIRFGDEIKYFFNYAHEDCFDGCDYYDLFYFTVTDGFAIYHGSYSFNVWEIPPPEPLWFDTARMAYLEYFGIHPVTQKRNALWH